MNEVQIEAKKRFIKDFINAKNPASGSKVDANANVTTKTMATLEAEMYKPETIVVNRSLVYDKINEMFGKPWADQYLQDIKEHLIYIHDETSLKPYCASITLYPFLMEGTKPLGGVSAAPQNLQSFCGSFSNFIYQVASDFAGAVATVEFLMYFDYFARKDFGDSYIELHEKQIKKSMKQVVYAMNTPAAARGNQSVFWNISLFDEYYFHSLFDGFYFPDGSQPNWDTLKTLQAYFLEWFRKERKKVLLTFPVVTTAYLVDETTKEPKDLEFIDLLTSEMAKGSSFFHYESTSADSLASCCRLRNEMEDNEFSYTLGAGGVSTGSFQVITLNINRMIQKRIRCLDDTYSIQSVVKRVHRYLAAIRALIVEYIDAGLLPSYTAGFISLDRQFGTIGLNGVLEAYESSLRDSHLSYEEYLIEVLGGINRDNKEARKIYGFKFNTEFVPAENLGVKNAKWDKEDGFTVPRDCYNSYFFPVEDDNMTILDRLAIHGEGISQYLDGGAACHLNLAQLPSQAQALSLVLAACRAGVPYWTTNVLCTICNDCGLIDPVTRNACNKCGSTNIDYGTRIIGYLKAISNFSDGRQKEALKRHYSGIRRV